MDQQNTLLRLTKSALPSFSFRITHRYHNKYMANKNNFLYFGLKMKQETRRLFIARLPFEATAEDLSDYFAQFGEITDVYCPKDPNNTPNNKGFGFVSFQNVLSSQQAISSGPHLINGREVVIDYALDRPTEEQQNNGSQDYFPNLHLNNHNRQINNTSSDYIAPNHDTFDHEHFSFRPGRPKGHYHDFNEHINSHFSPYNDFLKHNKNRSFTTPHNPFIPGLEYEASRANYPSTIRNDHLLNKSTQKEKLKFSFHLNSVKNDSLTALINFSDNLEANNNQYEMSQVNIANSPNELYNNLHTNQQISIDIHPKIIQSSVEESLKSKLFPASLEFNIHLPFDLFNELISPYNVDKLVACQFHFVTDSTNIEESSEFSESTPSSFSKRTKLQHNTARVSDAFYDNQGHHQLNLHIPQSSFQPIHNMPPTSSMQPPQSLSRTTKRPPGGNEWIKRGHRIYVGQLSPKTTSDDLKQYFQNFGEVVDAYIPKDYQNGISRGFGFVTFLEPHVAEDLISNASNRHDEINGTKINISKARPS